MPDPFDSPDGRTHSYGDGCQPAHAALVEKCEHSSDPDTCEDCMVANAIAHLRRGYPSHEAYVVPKAEWDSFRTERDILRAQLAAAQAELEAAHQVIVDWEPLERLQDEKIERLQAVIDAAREHINHCATLGYRLPLAQALAALDQACQ